MYELTEDEVKSIVACHEAIKKIAQKEDRSPEIDAITAALVGSREARAMFTEMTNTHVVRTVPSLLEAIGVGGKLQDVPDMSDPETDKHLRTYVESMRGAIVLAVAFGILNGIEIANARITLPLTGEEEESEVLQ